MKRLMSNGHGSRVLAVIPARGGSKGVPRKNIKPFAGKPLLAWTIEAAQESGVFARIMLTTEDEEIAQLGKRYGAEVPFLRPQELALDATPTAPVVRHTVEWLRDHDAWQPEWVMVLEPTSPCRRPFHLQEAARALSTGRADSLASVSVVPHHYAPDKLLKVHVDGTITGLSGVPIRDMVHRRQDLATHYAFNGLLFACKTDLVLRDPPALWGEQVMAYVVDPKYSIDLDQPQDWAAAEGRFQWLISEEHDVASDSLAEHAGGGR